MTYHIKRSVFYLETPRGRRFCVSTGPESKPSGIVLYFPPFAEELNKTRRMAAMMAAGMASRGWLTLQVDLAGCGDSEGEFADATLDTWLEDLAAGWNWLIKQAPKARRLLWSLRAGSLLLDAWLRRNEHQPDVLMWQPVFDGNRHLHQFLRLEVARLMLAEGETRTVVKRLREKLAGGTSIEVAGYMVSPGLAEWLSSQRFEAPAQYDGRFDVIDVCRESQGQTPALASRLDGFPAAGVRVRSHSVGGPAFWQTQEIMDAPAVITQSLAILDELRCPVETVPEMGMK